jgi:hypothetical protein
VEEEEDAATEEEAAEEAGQVQVALGSNPCFSFFSDVVC